MLSVFVGFSNQANAQLEIGNVIIEPIMVCPVEEHCLRLWQMREVET